MKKDGFILRDRSDGYPYKIRLWSLMTMTLFFIMILSLREGAVEAGGIPMWHEPGAAAGHYFKSPICEAYGFYRGNVKHFRGDPFRP